ncbi:CHAT domain-containing protein [Niabella aquatica]
MAVVAKIPGYYRILLFALGGGAILFFFMNATLQQPPGKTYAAFKEKDSLTGYINYLFDQLDAHPALANKSDSLAARIWRQPKSGEEKLAYYELLINTGYHLLQSGQVRASAAWYEKALLFYQQNSTDKELVPDMEFEEYVCKPLGNNYTRIGDFSKAVTIQQAAITAAIENNKTPMLPGLYANLAITYFYMRDYGAAQNIIDRGISGLSKDQQDIAALLYNLKTEAFVETKQIDSAVYWNNRALSLGSDHNSAAWHFSSLTQRARILNAENKFVQAMPYLQQAWQIAGNASVKEKAKLSNEIALALFQFQRFAESKRWFQQTLGFFEKDSLNLYPDYMVTSAMFGLALCYEVAQETDSASYWCVQAVLNDYYTQQLIDPWLYSKTSMYSNAGHTESAIDWHHQLYERTGKESYLLKALWMTELSKGRMLMSEQQRARHWQTDVTVSNTDFEELRNDYVLLAQANTEDEKRRIQQRISTQEYELSLKGKNFSNALIAPSYSSFIALLNQKRQTHTIVSYYSSGQKLYMIKADKKGISHFVDPDAFSEKDILGFTSRYFYKGPQEFNNDPARYFEQSNALLRKYLPGRINEGEDYIISAAGDINQLPFEALSTHPRQPVYLGAHHAINYQFSLLQLTNPSAGPKVKINFFGFENPHLGFPALPSAKAEAAFLKSHFRCTYQNAADEPDSLFYKALNEKNIIHLATHAVAGDSMGQSFIVLKNKLYLEQLQYNTTQSPLIVLAACETGRGASHQNEGIISLGRTFISKGVGGALSTRWQADDDATAALIKIFYKALKKEKYPAKALQKARAAYLEEHPGPAAQNPWLWAALFYQGKNAPIDIEPAGTCRWLIVLGIAGLLGLLVFKLKRNKKYSA